MFEHPHRSGWAEIAVEFACECVVGVAEVVAGLILEALAGLG